MARCAPPLNRRLDSAGRRAYKLAPMRDVRNIAAIIAALALMQVASGALAVAIPLALDARGSGPFAIGVTSAFYGLGLVMGAIAAPSLIARIGHIRAFAFFAAIAATLALLLYASIDPFAWSVVRLGLGACAAGLFTAGESWIASEASAARRGALLGVYHVLAKLALVVGVFVVGRVIADGPAPYMIAGGVFALCLAPVAATRQAAPPPPSTEPLPFRKLFAAAPAAVYACAAAGLVNGAVMGLAPIYAAQPASADAVDPAAMAATAAAFYAALTLGGVASQFPAGMLSDRVDRRLVVGALSAIAAAASFALALTPPFAPQALHLVLAFVWGAGALSFYGVAVAHAIDRSDPRVHARTMAGLLLVWAGGNVIGPPLAGLVMQAGLGGAGLFVYAGLGLAGLSFLMVRRSAKRAAAGPGQREPFAAVNATSFAAADLDPRTDDPSYAPPPEVAPATMPEHEGPVIDTPSDAPEADPGAAASHVPEHEGPIVEARPEPGAGGAGPSGRPTDAAPARIPEHEGPVVEPGSVESAGGDAPSAPDTERGEGGDGNEEPGPSAPKPGT